MLVELHVAFHGVFAKVVVVLIAVHVVVVVGENVVRVVVVPVLVTSMAFHLVDINDAVFVVIVGDAGVVVVVGLTNIFIFNFSFLLLGPNKLP